MSTTIEQDEANDEVGDVATTVIQAVREKYGEKISFEIVRCGLGNALSSLHLVALSSAKTEDEKRIALNGAMHTISTLVKCLKRDVEKLGIEGIEISSDEIGEDQIQ